MKFELTRPTDYSDDALLFEIKRVATLIDQRPLTTSLFNSNSKYSASTIQRRFGGWIEALKRAGLDESYLHLGNKKVPTEEILAELKRVAEVLHLKSFTREEFDANSNLTRFIFRRENAFNKVMKLAGLDVPKKSRKYTDNECFENLLNVWTYYRRQPSYSEMKNPPSIVGPKAYVLRWGGWTKALLAFVDKVNSDLTTDDSEPNSENQFSNGQKQKIISSPKERRDIPIGLRYDILKRDKFCCVICGSMPKIHNVTLEVDHIIPWVKGGKTTRDNLRTLCNKCNLGKSDKTE